jgi:hypothetical protein
MGTPPTGSGSRTAVERLTISSATDGGGVCVTGIASWSDTV